MAGGELVRQQRRARTTGTVVTLYDAQHPACDLDPDGGRWVTLCEAHSTVCNHETLELARSFAAAPEQWCEDCGDMLAEGRTYTGPDPRRES